MEMLLDKNQIQAIFLFELKWVRKQRTHIKAFGPRTKEHTHSAALVQEVLKKS